MSPVFTITSYTEAERNVNFIAIARSDLNRAPPTLTTPSFSILTSRCTWLMPRTNANAISVCPVKQAKCSGAFPSLLLSETSAQRSISASAISVCPVKQAKCRSA